MARKITEVAKMFQTSPAELLLVAVRMAGQSQLSHKRLVEILVNSGALEGIELADRDISTLAMGVGRRIAFRTGEIRSAEYL